MKYAIRKRRGKWTVCTEENILLDFQSYDEAVETARSATKVLAERSRCAPSAYQSSRYDHAESQHERAKHQAKA
jgi:hypothetical protein